MKDATRGALGAARQTQRTQREDVDDDVGEVDEPRRCEPCSRTKHSPGDCTNVDQPMIRRDCACRCGRSEVVLLYVDADPSVDRARDRTDQQNQDDQSRQSNQSRETDKADSSDHTRAGAGDQARRPGRRRGMSARDQPLPEAFQLNQKRSRCA